MTPQQGIPLTDAGNRLLAPVAANLDAGTVTGHDGTVLAVLTVRTASTTVTVMLNAPEFAAWMKVLTGLQASLGSGIQVVTPDQAQALGLNGRGPTG